ncbi:MAG: hypothetical protein ABIR33_07315 [Pyrinomonadaceae bacterium]
MYLQFIGVEGTIINLANIAMIDDESTETGGSKAVLTTTGGIELEFTGQDADAIFARAEVLIQATDLAIAQLSQIGVSQP